MLTSLPNRLKKASRWLPVALLPFAAQAQLNYAGGNAVNTTTTYTDLAATGTVITTASTDDANSASQPIGFTFNFNGAAFTEFVLNTNGYIKLGNTAPSAATLLNPIGSANALDVNIIAPASNVDLQTSATAPAEYRVFTTGAVGSRVTTIQWKNVADKATASPAAPAQFASMQFQTKLYEATNQIEFVYGTWVAGTGTPTGQPFLVGLKGSTNGLADRLLGSKTSSATAWTTTTFTPGAAANTLPTHFVRNTFPPDAGRTYRFVPGVISAPANDECAAATALTVGATCTPVTVTNAGATASTGAPAPGANCFLATTPVNNDVWFTVVVPTGGALTITTSAVTGSLVEDTGLVIYSGSCGALTEIGCSDEESTNSSFSSETLTGLTAGATLYVRVWSFGSTPAGQFGICAKIVPANDLAVQAIYTLGSASSYASPVPVSAVIGNVGATPSAARTATLTVSGATTYTSTQPVPAIAVGGETTVTFPAYPITATTGTNTLTVTLTTDDAPANNTAVTTQVLTAGTLSYNIPGEPFVGGFGSNTTANTTVYVKYRTNTTPTTVTAVTPTFFGPTTASNNYQVLVLDATGPGGLPGAVLYTSPARVRPLAGGADAVAVPGIPVSGDFYVAARQLTTNNFGLSFQDEVPLRTGTFFISTNGIAFTDLSVANTTFRAAVGVTLSNPLATRNEALAATLSLSPNPAHGSFTLSVPAGSLRTASATLINVLGQVVQTRQLNLPASGGNADFDVSRLAPGVYSLSLKSGNDLVVKRVVVE